MTRLTTAATFAFPPMRDGTPHVPRATTRDGRANVAGAKRGRGAGGQA